MSNKQCNLYNIEAKFKNYLKNNNFSRTSINNYLADLRHFLSWLVLMLKKQNLVFEVNYFNKKTFELYKNHLAKLKTPSKTINRRLSTLRAFIRFCLHIGWLDYNPLIKLNNIKIPQKSWLPSNLKKHTPVLFLFSLGLLIFLTIIALPWVFLNKNAKFSRQFPSLLSSDTADIINSLTLTSQASTSADLLTIPIIDSRGNLNLTASYPKIIGYKGALTIEAPEVKLKSIDRGSIVLNSKNGSFNFIFEGKKPPLPYDAVFNFSAKNLQENGALIYGQVQSTKESIRLLELVSGSPAQTKFSVDANGNVHIKGNLILEGNLIVNPKSTIFGTFNSETATTSASPEISN